ncbi:hypothetical protein TVAG_077040 [Trichomonas vaginalis G3]|uniref:Uncharacterized protein n=1 Tax=Trichomonas vaginalis (strain ATCC PRA-98 / G3) TaxID=412133 RepID=A2D9V1_TRIV3|nr:hypothetical protein TVAGG3_0291270 [Trichomonas vaginalis G3]EAY22957.1 hypothetical protein TVAG_077040 [Trichomonas vaginalis G3]KAI5527291.1 hypothetical protein TVAGG3_0291270 [Trichomonas vaginalis G3]|eukprot:XP_001583943.1 hypothetical protein [Trichomonas vaginalis G3]
MFDLDNFFNNFRLTFVGRDLNEPLIQSSPASLTEARAQILKKQQKQTAEEDPYLLGIQTLYLNAIGEMNEYSEPKQAATAKINELFQNNLISPNSYGFLNEMEENSRSARVKIPENKINVQTYQELYRFCYAHGIHPTHDITLDELQRMTEWISKNEIDHVAYTKMPEFMQQAIDLSVIAQNVDKLSKSLAQDTRLTEIIRNHVNESEEKLDLTNKSLTDIAQLNQYLIQEGRSLPAMKYQENTLRSYTEPHLISDETFPVESEEQETQEDENHSNDS